MIVLFLQIIVQQQNGSVNQIGIPNTLQYNGSDEGINLTNGINTRENHSHLMNGFDDNSVNVDVSGD